MIELFLIIYLVGFLVALFQAIKAYTALERASNKMQKLIVGSTSPTWLLTKRVVGWPYYIIRYHSPMSFLSELFFKHYGDPDKSYAGTQGILNFYHDIFHRRYYENIKAKRTLIELNYKSVIYRKAVDNSLVSQGDTAYASIIFAKDVKNNFFLSINFCRDYRDYTGDVVSRYELYSCQKLSEKTFISSVNTAIRMNCGEQLVDQLNQ